MTGTFEITQALVDEALAVPFSQTDSSNCVVAMAMSRHMNVTVGNVLCGYTLATVLRGEKAGTYQLSDNSAGIVTAFDKARGAKFRDEQIPAVPLGVISYELVGE